MQDFVDLRIGRTAAPGKADNPRSAKALCIITPAAIGPEYLREATEVVEAAAGGPPNKSRMMEIMLRHGLTPAIPPPQA